MMSQIDSNSSQAHSITSRERTPSQKNNPSEETKATVENKMAKLLLEFSNRKSSGLLEITYREVHWKLFFENGNLNYASMSAQTLESLSYHLRTLDYKKALEALKVATANEKNKQKLELASLDLITSWLRQKQSLNPDQVSAVARRITREAIEPLFWLTEIQSNWEEINPEAPAVSIVPPLDIPALVEEFLRRLQSWQKLLDQINSPYQRPYFFKTPTEDNISNPKLLKLAKLMRGFSIRQLASIVKQDEIKFAQLLYPSLKSGEIFLRKPEAKFDQLPAIPRLPQPEPAKQTNSDPATKIQSVKIACVDDSPTILREIQRLLGEEKYELTKIDNPIEAASVLFRVKPDLVLMDISMPEINGYKLCSLLRNSKALCDVPIIMVTSRTGVIDKVRAKASGATDYLTKPFSKESLLEVIEKHLN